MTSFQIEVLSVHAAAKNSISWVAKKAAREKPWQPLRITAIFIKVV
jgi:hypothetical protein